MNPQMSQQKYYLTYQFASVYLFDEYLFFFCFCSFYSRAFEDLFTFVYFWLPWYDELKNWLQKETYANI